MERDGCDMMTESGMGQRRMGQKEQKMGCDGVSKMKWVGWHRMEWEDRMGRL